MTIRAGYPDLPRYRRAGTGYVISPAAGIFKIIPLCGAALRSRMQDHLHVQEVMHRHSR
jgi:hypothetical protein